MHSYIIQETSGRKWRTIERFSDREVALCRFEEITTPEKDDGYKISGRRTKLEYRLLGIEVIRWKPL